MSEPGAETPYPPEELRVQPAGPAYGQPEYGQPSYQPPAQSAPTYGTPPPLQQAGYGLPGQPPGYAPPPVYPGVIGPATSAAAVASLVCGILALFTCGLTAIPGIITGHIGVSATSGGRMLGRPMAIIGLILSYLVLVFSFLMLVLQILGVAGFLAMMPFRDLVDAGS